MNFFPVVAEHSPSAPSPSSLPPLSQAEYFRLAQQLIARGLLPPLGDMQQLQQLSVKELKRLVEAHGLSSVGCLEKGDLLAKLEPLLAQNGK